MAGPERPPELQTFSWTRRHRSRDDVPCPEWCASRLCSPRVDSPSPGVAELARVPGDDGASACGCNCRKKGIRRMVVERLAASAAFLHEPRACLRISHEPRNDPVLEQLVERILEPVGGVAPSPAGIEPAIPSSTPGSRGKRGRGPRRRSNREGWRPEARTAAASFRGGRSCRLATTRHFTHPSIAANSFQPPPIVPCVADLFVLKGLLQSARSLCTKAGAPDHHSDYAPTCTLALPPRLRNTRPIPLRVHFSGARHRGATPVPQPFQAHRRRSIRQWQGRHRPGRRPSRIRRPCLLLGLEGLCRPESAFGRSKRVTLSTHGGLFSADLARKDADDAIARIERGQPPVPPEPADSIVPRPHSPHRLRHGARFSAGQIASARGGGRILCGRTPRPQGDRTRHRRETAHFQRPHRLSVLPKCRKMIRSGAFVAINTKRRRVQPGIDHYVLSRIARLVQLVSGRHTFHVASANRQRGMSGTLGFRWKMLIFCFSRSGINCWANNNRQPLGV